MDIDINNLFEGIKSSLNEKRVQTTNVLKFKMPKNGAESNEYLLRILPYTKEGNDGLKKTFFYYLKYYWKDDLDGQKTHNILSRKTFGESCPISNYYFKVKKDGNQWEKERLNSLKYQQGWYCNVYVINDPVEPENNGKVMALSLNKTLYGKVKDAIDGKLDKSWSSMATRSNPKGEEVVMNVGKMVFDLSNNGVNFKVVVKPRGEFPDYTASAFTLEGTDLNLSPEKQKEILDSCIDVTKIEKERSTEEIRQYFKKEFLHQTGDEQPSARAQVTAPAQQPVVETHNETPADVFGGDEIPGLGVEKPQQATIPNTEADMRSFLATLSKKDNNSNPADGFNFD